jgi:RNA recognition motif-containing protein
VALNPQGVTQQQWRAADEHLRESLLTAIENPRGKQIQNQKNKKAKKNGKKQKKDNNMFRHSNGNNSSIKKIDITTLSAASAAQNLAVFLKSFAMTFDEDSSQRKQHLYEAKNFYDNVLMVRSQLLPYDHPDLYATKYSLAELLEVLASSTRGSDDDENNNNNKDKDKKDRHQEAANTLRQEIIDTYDPPDLENEGGRKDAIDIQQVATGVIVEKTVTSKKSS